MKKIEFDDFDFISHTNYKPHWFSVMKDRPFIFVDKDTHQIFYEIETEEELATAQEHYENFKDILDEEKVNYIENSGTFMIAPSLDWLIEKARIYKLKTKKTELEKLKKAVLSNFLLHHTTELEAEG